MQGEDRRRRPARGRLAAVGVWLGLGGGLGWGAPGCAAPRSSAPVVEASEPAPLPAWELGPSLPQAERFAAMALDCVHREYPNKVAHVLAGPQDVGTPAQLTPVFYGCFDWHSAVHGHWLLARLARRFPDTSLAASARAALDTSLVPEAIATEVSYVGRDDRIGFERPYGLAWLLQLAAELRAWEDPQARRWARTLAPLEDLAARRLAEWIPKLSHPIRSGEHSQTAFAFGLALDWARERDDDELARMLVAQSLRLYGSDRDCALHLEPSGHDFLSPCLGAADLMRRVLPPRQFSTWLTVALPQVPADGSTAWLPLAAVSDEHYAGGHWLASFAVYLSTRRGRPEGG